MSHLERKFKIFWLAGENSGDLHASLVMKKLNENIPNLEHVGIGGTLMQRNGLKALYPFDRFAVMGFAEVLKHILFFLGVERRIKRYFEEHKPDLAILVDYPGLNLRIARMADDERIPVLYYICPQFWAWKRKRVYKLKENVRHVACILPFEKELLDIYNVTSSYVGHPIAEEIVIEQDKQSFARFFGLNDEKQWIGFMPGSRASEIERLLPDFLKAAEYFSKQGYEILFSKARSVSHQQYMHLIENHSSIKIKLIDGYNYEMMKYCKLLIACSGTVTLEAAFIGTPLVICYRTSELSYRIAKNFVRIKRIGLPNIILDEDLLPELVQEKLSASSIISAASYIIDDDTRYNDIRSRLLKLRGLLEGKKTSNEMLNLVKKMLKIDA